MAQVLAGLWRQPAFLKLWFGQTISLIGSWVSQLAVGLTAALISYACLSDASGSGDL